MDIILFYNFNSLIWLTGIVEVVSTCSRQPKLITCSKNDNNNYNVPFLHVFNWKSNKHNASLKSGSLLHGRESGVVRARTSNSAVAQSPSLPLDWTYARLMWGNRGKMFLKCMVRTRLLIVSHNMCVCFCITSKNKRHYYTTVLYTTIPYITVLYYIPRYGTNQCWPFAQYIARCFTHGFMHLNAPK